MNLSTDSSDCSDSDGSVRGRGKEPLPENVPFYFLKTGKSKGEGVLITHNGTFKFTKNNVNRKGTLHYYACSHKLTHKCQARAIIKKEVEVDEAEGRETVHFILLEVATPEVFRIQYFMRQNSLKVLCRQELESVCLRITEQQTSES